MTAHTATPAEKPRLWQLVTDVWPNYDVYQIADRTGHPRRGAVTVVTSAGPPPGEWVERAVERSAAVQRSRLRIAQQVRQMLDAARRLIDTKGDEFTTQELCAEAGVALQTFYRYFASKDELLLAVIGDAMTDACERWAAAAAELPDPLARLRYYLTSTLEPLDGAGVDAATARFIVSTRWQLHRNYAEELAEAEKPFVDLLRVR